MNENSLKIRAQCIRRGVLEEKNDIQYPRIGWYWQLVFFILHIFSFGSVRKLMRTGIHSATPSVSYFRLLQINVYKSMHYCYFIVPTSLLDQHKRQNFWYCSALLYPNSSTEIKIYVCMTSWTTNYTKEEHINLKECAPAEAVDTTATSLVM